ncbi:putative RING finger protein P8B7.23 [Exophiala dermatitidis]
MSSSATSNPASTKLPPSSNSSNYAQSPSSSGIEPLSKRNNSSGSFGSATSTRQTAQARGNQPLRKQHKGQRKPRLLDDDAIAETAAMRSINSRKGQTSITHLMNFSLPPRPPQHYQHHFNHRHQRRNPTWGLGSGYHAVDKARYVHANYRFIVRPDREYRAQTVDADVYVSWDAVLQVLASAETQAASCPICLSTPVAPRMAKCGHIFCLPCLIRYMHSSDEANPAPERKPRWKKCPICEDSIYMSEARPVRWISGNDAHMLREGGDVLLKLLVRDPGSTLALPRDTADGYGRADDIPWYHVAEMMEYARFMKGSEDYMTAQYDQEIAAIEAQEKEDELIFGDDTTWTQKAVLSIEDAKQKLTGLGNPPPSASAATSTATAEATTPSEMGVQAGPSSLTNAMHTLSLGQGFGLAKPTSTTTQSGPGSSRPPSHPFYFYHALPNFFLSPLDIRILKTAFGDFSAFPSTILPRVEHISTGHIIDDELRKRAKYMTHLPYGYEVSFLECDWTDIISPTILDQFHDDLARRRKRKSEKEAREERDRIRAEKEDDEKRWASTRRRRPSSVPKAFTDEDFRPLVDTHTHPSSSPGESALAVTPPWATSRSHSSFAPLASPGTSPDAPRTVWGTALIAPASPVLAPRSEPASRDDGWLQGWEKDLLDDDDPVAMVEASINGGSSSQPKRGGGPSKKGKKKKITLMSTNNRRGA